MKIQFLTLLSLLIATVASAADTTTNSVIKPTAVIPNPPGVVCAMVVCSSATSSLVKRADDTPTCPVTCPNDCKIIDDVCCPGQKKAVCNVNNSTSAGASSVRPSATGTSLMMTTTTSSVVPSSVSASANVSASASASAITSTSVSTAKSDATSYTAASVLSTCMLVTLLAVGLNQGL